METGFKFLLNKFADDEKICVSLLEKGIKFGCGGDDEVSGLIVMINPLSHILGSAGYAMGSFVGIGSKIFNYTISIFTDFKNILQNPLNSFASLLVSPFFTLAGILYDIIKLLLSSLYCVVSIGVTVIGGSLYLVIYVLPSAICIGVGHITKPIINLAKG